MYGIAVTLPGGLSTDDGIERQARFHPLTGRIEQKLIEFTSAHNRTDYVTAVLSSTLQSIGKQPVTNKLVSTLCVADRQYLMLRLAAMLDGEQVWLKLSCGHCHSLFDVDIQRCDLPVKPAGENYPRVTLQLKNSTINARIPTGEDQQKIAELSDEQAMFALLKKCICSVNGDLPSEEFIRTLSEADIESIDETLDEVSPAVCNQLLVNCPECGREQYAELDHYDLSGINRHFFYHEVHTLASHYHWSEAEILDLPQSRRHLYLDMINRSSAVSGRG